MPTAVPPSDRTFAPDEIGLLGTGRTGSTRYTLAKVIADPSLRPGLTHVVVPMGTSTPIRRAERFIPLRPDHRGAKVNPVVNVVFSATGTPEDNPTNPVDAVLDTVDLGQTITELLDNGPVNQTAGNHHYTVDRIIVQYR